MKTKFSKKVLALVLVLALALPMFVFTANAETGTASISFASTAQRESLNSDKQVWKNGGITFTNNKASSTNAVKDYSNPVRLYAKSSIIIECTLGKITKIAFETSGGDYLTALQNSITDTKTTSGTTVTVTLDGTSDTYTIASLSAQVRLKSITVTYEKASSAPVIDYDALNAVGSSMSLGYKYDASTQYVPYTIDTLNLETTGRSGTSYGEWSGKTVNSNAVYAGQSAGGNSSIQLRSTNSNSGIITTASGGNVAKITVTWNSNTADGRTLQVYGKATAYTSPTELYDDSKGTLLGTIVCGTSTTLEITGDYAYIGLRSLNGAMYIDSIEISWKSEGGALSSVDVYENSHFAIRCGVDASIANVAANTTNATEYGIKVSAGGKDKYYDSTAASWAFEGGIYYVIVDLGDIINDTIKLGTEFSVQAYVKVGTEYYVSTSKTTYSVADMVDTYYNGDNAEVTAAVTHLYNYLVSKGLIEIDE